MAGGASVEVRAVWRPRRARLDRGARLGRGALLAGAARLGRVAALLACLALPAPPALALEPGQVAPDFRLPARGGGTLSLRALEGKVVLVDFWASWCPPCRRSLPWLSEQRRKLAARGFEVIAVNVDKDAPEIERFLRAVSVDLPIALDPEGVTPPLYGVKGMPSSFLVGRDGRVVSTHVGFREESKAGLEAEFVRALEASRR